MDGLGRSDVWPGDKSDALHTCTCTIHGAIGRNDNLIT